MGTVILTLSVTGIEVMMIAAFVYRDNGNVSLARNTMFAVVMIVLNGMVGLSLLLGGLRYHEQTYNIQGANAFLAVIVQLAVLGLVLPSYTISSPGPTFSPHQSTFLIVMSPGVVRCVSRDSESAPPRLFRGTPEPEQAKNGLTPSD